MNDRDPIRNSQRVVGKLKDGSTSSGVTGQFITGVFLVLAGVIFLLDNLDYLNAWTYLRYWPVTLIVFGVIKLFQARAAAGWVAGLTWMVVGTLFLMDTLNIMNIDLRDLWPLFLVWLGAFMLLKSKNRATREALDDKNSTISATAILGGMERRNNSPDFKGGELTAVMGGCEIDLSNAQIHGEAVVDVFAFWGGVELKVPPDWTIISKVYPILGGFEDASQPPKEDSKRLIIRGFAIMGGVGVKN